MSRKKGVPPAWYEAGLAHVWLPYAQMKTARAPLPVARTHGSRIVLADGRELIDGIASWWTACHGYNHPHIRQAVERQLALMPHVMFGGLAHEQALTLAGRLAALMPGDLNRVFFSESGSVAVEIAMKMALQFWLNRGMRKRRKFLAFKGGYHGDTIGAMAVCDPDAGMHARFRGVLPEHCVVGLPESEESAANFARCFERHAEELAGIIVEPLVQGAGGMRFHSPSVLQRLREAANRCELVLIFDEIFTGFGRTGRLLACAAANASLDLFEREPRLRQVADIATALEHGLAPCRGLPGVKDVRVKGAIGVVELDRIDDLESLRVRFVEEGVFVRPFGSIIYLTPAFTISAEELARLMEAVVNVVHKRN